MKASRPARPPTVAEDAAAPPEEGTAGLTGPEVIASYVKRLPAKPGVYRMYSKDGDILYVGKAKNLKNRVGNYAKGGGHNNRIALMIALTRSMEFVVTETETEALLARSQPHQAAETALQCHPAR
jgi:excinuclease ABC subunit C